MSKNWPKVFAKRTAEILMSKKFLPTSARYIIENMVDNSYYKSGIGYPYRGYEAMDYLLKNFEFDSVLDIGCGEGIHSDIFLEAGKDVTAIDYGKSYYFNKRKTEPRFKCIVSDFMKYDFQGEQFDCVWCSHILEHQLNPHDFLKKVISLLNIRRGGGGISYKCAAVPA